MLRAGKTQYWLREASGMRRSNDAGRLGIGSEEQRGDRRVMAAAAAVGARRWALDFGFCWFLSLLLILGLFLFVSPYVFFWF